ncbi:MAG: hypothetical protein JXR76_14270 [Deltaproteobacteria bacterium]|nr:hypothetical protein [Deltaproteobacteria bacterium]
MNDRHIDNLLSDARSTLEPTPIDRERMHRKVMGAVGVATVVTAASASAAKATSGLASSLGISGGAVAVVKITVSGLLLGGVIALGAAGINELEKDTTEDVPRKVTRWDDGAGTVHADPVPIGPSEQFDERDEIPPIPFEKGGTTISEPIESNDGTAISAPLSRAPKRGTTAKTAPIQNATPDRGDDQVLQELAMIKTAVLALRQNDFSRAIQLLEDCKGRFPHGSMRQERDGLYISALCGAGNIQRAKKADAAFRRRYKNAPVMVQVAPECQAPGNAMVRDTGN